MDLSVTNSRVASPKGLCRSSFLPPAGHMNRLDGIVMLTEMEFSGYVNPGEFRQRRRMALVRPAFYRRRGCMSLIAHKQRELCTGWRHGREGLDAPASDCGDFPISTSVE